VGLLEYCMSDVTALAWLLTEMTPRLPANLKRSLYRGLYMIPTSASMNHGVPVDEASWQRLLSCREDIILEVINGHPAYDGTAFRYDYFTKWLQDLRDRGLIRGWPVTATGKPSFSEKTLRRFSSVPEIEVFRQIRSVVTILEEPRFEIRQGRHYYSLLPFT